MTPTLLLETLRQARACGVSSQKALMALCLLARDNKASLSSLSIDLKLSTAAMTGIADKLEATNLVTREWPRHDRRMCYLCLTPEGHTALTDILNPTRNEVLI